MFFFFFLPSTNSLLSPSFLALSHWSPALVPALQNLHSAGVANTLHLSRSQKDPNRFDRDRLFSAVIRGSPEALEGLLEYLRRNSKFLTNSEYTGRFPLLELFVVHRGTCSWFFAFSSPLSSFIFLVFTQRWRVPLIKYILRFFALGLLNILIKSSKMRIIFNPTE